MPPINSWMVITFRIPFLLAILILLILIGSAAYSLFEFQRKSRQTRTLSQKLKEQNARIDTLMRQEPSLSSVHEAYLQFIYIISHEVANPLQSVQINLENMADCSSEEIGRRNQYYEIIKQEIKRLSTLTDNLRLLSHLERADEPIKREPVNLASVIQYVIMAQAERAEKKSITLNYQGPNRPAKVLGNRDYLNQLIINLVDNSIKYSKESGGEIVIKLAEENNWMMVTVSDHGIGIPQEDLPFVFDTAYRSPNPGSIKQTGSGLGLAIVKRIVDQHEGKINVESIFGQGTTVTIDLPVYNPAGQE